MVSNEEKKLSDLKTTDTHVHTCRKAADYW